MKNILTIIFCLGFMILFSQEEILSKKISENGFKFSSVDPLLTQIAGAPEPFYTYWWEFGDGHYSTEETPTHFYDSKNNYNLFLARTNNYDDGPARPTKKKKISVDTANVPNLNQNDIYLDKNEILSLNKNHNPKPNEEIIFVQTYKNTSIKPQKGTLVFFYNEKAFEKDHFVLADYRNHFNEIEFPVTKNILFEKIETLENKIEYSTSLNDDTHYNNYTASTSKEFVALEFSRKGKEEIENDVIYFDELKNIKKEISEAYADYNNVIAFKFDDLKPNEERNLFMSFNTTNEMLEDTNASISIQSIFIPDDYKYSTRIKHMMPIVTAHDPNFLTVNKIKTYKAYSKKKGLNYKIKFQNVGKGPAEEIKLRFYNNADIEVKSIEIIDFEPFCPICPDSCSGSYMDTIVTDEYIEFFFHNVYLPGKRQKDLENKDATKGFVKFNLKTEKKIKQNNITCRTDIYFDKEDPIKTNRARTTFDKPLFFGFIAGTAYHPIQTPKFDLFFAGTFTFMLPNQWSYRGGLGINYMPSSQVDVLNVNDSNYIEKKFGYSAEDPNGNIQVSAEEDSLSLRVLGNITDSEIENKKQSISIQVTPFELRKDLSEMLSLGFGVSSTFNVASYQKTITSKNIDKYSTTVDKTIEFVESSPNGYVVKTFRISNPVTSLESSETTREDTGFSSESYKLDFASGLFLDINLGKIYSFPYFGARLNLDYQFGTQNLNPSFKFYLGANF